MKIKAVLFLIILIVTGAACSGCGKNDSEKDADLNKLWSDIESGTNPETMPMFAEGTDEDLETNYGISPEDLDAYILRYPMMIVKSSEVFIAKVKEGKMDAVKSGIEKRRKALEETWSNYLPDQYELVKNYKIETHGNYVLFVVSEQTGKITDIFREAVS